MAYKLRTMRQESIERVLLQVPPLSPHEESPSAEENSGERSASKKKRKIVVGIVVNILAGVIFSFWSPVAAMAVKGEGKLNLYTVLFWVYLGGWLGSFAMVPFFMRRPLTNAPPLPLHSYLKMERSSHLWGLFSGFLTCAGSTFFLISSTTLGYAVSFSIGMAGPLITCLFGLFVWKEFKGVCKKTKIFIAVTFVCYIAAIALVASAK